MPNHPLVNTREKSAVESLNQSRLNRMLSKARQNYDSKKYVLSRANSRLVSLAQPLTDSPKPLHTHKHHQIHLGNRDRKDDLQIRRDEHRKSSPPGLGSSELEEPLRGLIFLSTRIEGRSTVRRMSFESRKRAQRTG